MTTPPFIDIDKMAPGSLIIKKQTQKESNKNKKPTKKARKIIQSNPVDKDDLYSAPVRKRNHEDDDEDDKDKDNDDPEYDQNQKHINQDNSEDDEEYNEEKEDDSQEEKTMKPTLLQV